MSVIGRPKGKPKPDPNEVPTDDQGNEIAKLPHDDNAERALLSMCIVGGAAGISLVDRVAWFRAEMMFAEANRRIWEAIVALRDAGKPVDATTVSAWLGERDRLAQVGGMKYIGSVLLCGSAIDHVESYARIVADHWRVRKALLVCRQAVARANQDHGSADDYLGQLEREVLEIGGGYEGKKPVEIGAVVKSVYDSTAAAQTAGRIPGIHRGFSDWDAKTLGLHPGDLGIIAARPGMGKTSLALCVAVNVARRPPELFGVEATYSGVAFFSLEMPKEQCVQRIFAFDGRVDFSAIRAARLTQDQWGRMTAAARRLHTLPIKIDDTPGLEIQALRAKVRRIKSEMAQAGYRHGAPTTLRVVIVDYLQLLKAKGETIRSREQEVSYCARELKELAKDEDVAVVALAQLNRAVESRTGADRRPRMGDLRESGEIEQAADDITLVHREEAYGTAANPGDEGKTELIVAKQRNGAPGTVHVRFVGAYTAFEDFR